MAKRKSVFSKRQSMERTIQTMKNETNESAQMLVARKLGLLQKIILLNFTPPIKSVGYQVEDAKPKTFKGGVFAAYKSTHSNLHQTDEEKLTEWGHTLDYAQLRKDVLGWIKGNCIEEVFLDQREYEKTTMDYHLAYFNPRVWLEDNIVKYGINEGRWPEPLVNDFNNNLEFYIKDLKWTSYNINDTDPSIGSWKELIQVQPMFSLMRHDATSCFPHYKPQTEEYILVNYPWAIKEDPLGYVTGYYRSHGLKYTIDIYGNVKLVEKDRFVGGVEFCSKIKGLPITYSFYESKPWFTPYYKPWKEVFVELLSKWLEYEGFFGFTTDQSGFDQKHNRRLVEGTALIMAEYMPDHIKKDFLKVVYSDYNNPYIILNAFYKARLGRWLSISGSPTTPLIETLNNCAAHRFILDEMDISILYELTQIDDTVYFVDKEVDLDKFAKLMFEYLGFKVNPAKTETTKKRFLVYLQNLFGKILKYELPTISDLSWKDGLGVISHMMRKIHRMKWKERIRQVAGDVRFTIENEIGHRVDVPVFFARCVGILGSFGPWIPESLLKILYRHFLYTRIKITKALQRQWPAYLRYDVGEEIFMWPEIVSFCKDKSLKVGVLEYGFDPLFIIADIARRF